MSGPSRLTRSYVNRAWEESLGQDFDLDHYREPCPGRRHAQCSPTSRTCRVHGDRTNPHCSVTDAVKHFVESDLGKTVLIVGGIAGAVGLAWWLNTRSRSKSVQNQYWS
jgi:hypothetical protein